MGVEERKQIWRFYQIYKIERKIPFRIGMYSLLCSFLYVMIQFFVKLFGNAVGTNYISTDANGSLALIIGIFYCFYQMINFRKFNQQHIYYPQTAATRYWVILLEKVRVMFFYLLFGYALYLVQCAMFYSLKLLHVNVFFVYEFDLKYVVISFLVDSLYVLLIISLFQLLTVLEDTFGYLYQIFMLVGLLCSLDGLFMVHAIFSKFLVNAVGFILSESSIIKFVLKVLFFTIVFLVLSYTIHTLNYSNRKFRMRLSKWIISSVQISQKELPTSIGAAFITYFISWLIFSRVFYEGNVTSNYSYEKTAQEFNISYDEMIEIYWDDFDTISNVFYTENQQGNVVIEYIPSIIFEKLGMTPDYFTLEEKIKNLFTIKNSSAHKQYLINLVPSRSAAMLTPFKDKNIGISTLILDNDNPALGRIEIFDGNQSTGFLIY